MASRRLARHRLRRAALSGDTTLVPVSLLSFPTTTLLGFQVMLALDADPTAHPDTWAWTDVTASVRYASRIAIFRGRADEQAETNPSTCDLLLENLAGVFSPRNPSSVYYGRLGKNTPLRIDVNPGTGWVRRFTGFIPAWPPRRDLTGTDFTIPIHAVGVLGRLGQGEHVTKSYLRRSFEATTTDAAYWPCEDATGARSAAVLLGGVPLTATPALEFGTQTPPLSSSATPDFSTGGRLFGPLPAAATSSTHKVVQFIVRLDTSGTTFTIGTIGATGSVTSWQLQATASALILRYKVGGAGYATAVSLTTINLFDGEWHGVAVEFVPNGANIDTTLYLATAGVNDEVATASVAGQTLGQFTAISVGGVPGGMLQSLAHLVVAYGAVSPYALLFDSADHGQTAQFRFQTLCDSEGISHDAAGDFDASALLGVSTVAPLLDALRETQDADAGMLIERLTGELGFDGHDTRENLPVTMTLDYTAHELAMQPEATDDDQRIANDVTVTRARGGSRRVLDETGPLGTTVVGSYPQTPTLNVATDDQAEVHAGHLVVHGTVDELRYPTIKINLSAHPDLIAAWLTCDIGARIQIINLPDDLPPAPADLLLEGYLETMDQFLWEVELNCSPYEPWRIFRTALAVGDINPFLGYLVPDWSLTAEALDPTETEILFFSEPRFSTGADDWYPPALLSLRPATAPAPGEQVSLTGVASAALDSFTRTLADSWGTLTSGQSWTTNQTAADWDVTGTAGTITITTLSGDYIARFDAAHTDADQVATFSLGTLPASGTYQFGLVGRCTTITVGAGAYMYYGEAQINTAGQVTLRLRKRINGAVPTTIATRVIWVLAAATTYRLRFAVVGTTLSVKIWPASKTEPEGWLLSATDTAIDGVTAGSTQVGVFARNDTAATTHILTVDDYELARPQLATVVRSVNGVTKAHPAGVSLDFTHPGVLGL